MEEEKAEYSNTQELESKKYKMYNENSRRRIMRKSTKQLN